MICMKEGYSNWKIKKAIDMLGCIVDSLGFVLDYHTQKMVFYCNNQIVTLIGIQCAPNKEKYKPFIGFQNVKNGIL